MTPLQKFLDQIVLKKVKGSVYLVPAITDIQIEDILAEETEILLNYQKWVTDNDISILDPEQMVNLYLVTINENEQT